MSASPNGNRAGNGRRWSFSLLTVLVVTSIAAAFFGGWAFREHWSQAPGSALGRPNVSPRFAREQAKKSLQVYVEDNELLQQSIADIKSSGKEEDRITHSLLEEQLRRNDRAIAQLKDSLSLFALFKRPQEWAVTASLWLSVVVATFVAGVIVGRRQKQANPGK